MKRTRKSGDERRDEIARAVLAIVDERGTGALSVASVAHRVGVAPSALYRHFPDKDAILEDMLFRLGTGVRANLERAVAEGAGDPVGALDGLLKRHVAFILANRGFPLLLFSDLIQHHAVRRERVSAILAHFRGVVAGLLRRGQEMGVVRSNLDPEAGSFAFVGLFIPPALDWHLSGGRTDLAGIVRRAWSIYHAGIRTPGKPSRSSSRAPRRATSREKRS